MRGAVVSELGRKAPVGAPSAAADRKAMTHVEPRKNGMTALSLQELRRMSDTELIEAFIDGNEQAYAVLYERLHKDVWRFAMKMMKYDEDKASDAFQEIFIKVYEKADSFKSKGSVKSWMMMITRNVCLNIIRSEKRSAAMDEPDDVPSQDQALEPDHVHEQNALREIIEQAFDLLPDDLREAITLREVEGLSYEEIASATGTNLGVIRQRIWRARQKLRKHLAPYLKNDYSFALDK